MLATFLNSHSFAVADDRSELKRRALFQPLVAVLRQLEEVIENLKDEQYRMKPVGIVGSSIGGHVRHCLDHVDALLRAIDMGELNYDHRERGTDVETNPLAARAVIHRQERQLLALWPDVIDHPLRMKTLLGPALPPQEVETSVGRELAFVLSHTVHHNALVDVMARILGVAVRRTDLEAPALPDAGQGVSRPS